MESLVETYRRIKPAAVAIGAPKKEQDGTLSLVFTGSGVCVDPKGVIVTCAHVLAPDTVDLAGGRGGLPEAAARATAGGQEPDVHVTVLPLHAIFFYEGEDHGYWGKAVPGGYTLLSRSKDLAVFRLQDPHFDIPGSPYPAAILGDSSTLAEGETVAASGFPFGHEFREMTGSANSTLSVGIVSAILPAPPAVRSPGFAKFQLDMTVNGGNSGGPVFRPDNAEVIGVVSEVIAHIDTGTPYGIAFGIPINLAKPAIGRVATGGRQGIGSDIRTP